MPVMRKIRSDELFNSFDDGQDLDAEKMPLLPSVLVGLAYALLIGLAGLLYFNG